MNIPKEKLKEGGRKGSRKGVPNKSTTEIRENFQLLIENRLPELNKAMKELLQTNPDKGIRAVLEMAKFVLPQLQRSQINMEIKEQALLHESYNRTETITLN